MAVIEEVVGADVSDLAGVASYYRLGPYVDPLLAGTADVRLLERDERTPDLPAFSSGLEGDAASRVVQRMILTPSQAEKSLSWQPRWSS